MRAITLAVTVLALFVSMVLIFWLFARLIGNGWYAVIRDRDERQITKAIRQSLNDNLDQVKVETLTDFDWERVCVIDTGTSRSSIETMVGHTVPWTTESVPWMNDEDYCTFIFLDGSGTTKLVKL